MTDVPSSRHASTPFRPEERRLRHSTSFDSNSPCSVDDDLDVEDPLSQVYVRDDEFERFSKTEIGFITASCIGVVIVPSLYLLVR